MNRDEFIQPKVKEIHIGLDWDGTVTVDPVFWYLFAKQARERGFKVHIVTMRYPEERLLNTAITQTWESVTDSINFTSRKSKRSFMEEKGIKIDIWIDDNPRAVEENAEAIFKELAPSGVVLTE